MTRGDGGFSRRDGLRWGVAAVSLMVVCGCERAGPHVQMVKGRLLVDGEAVGGVTVMFTPVDDKGMAAVGRTNAEGVFQLTARRGHQFGAGTTVGRYKVTISKQVLVDERTGRMEETMPYRFTKLEQTPLDCDVTADVNAPEFNVISKPR